MLKRRMKVEGGNRPVLDEETGKNIRTFPEKINGGSRNNGIRKLIPVIHDSLVGMSTYAAADGRKKTDFQIHLDLSRQQGMKAQQLLSLFV